MKPRLLDLFCCAGGAGMGYHLAGFEVVGVDIKPQPRYPFEFHQGSVSGMALRYAAGGWCVHLDGAGDLGRFDAIHASPPCQAHTAMKTMPSAKRHEDLIGETRAKLQWSGVPWVMENVVGAPLVRPHMLCGTMFGLGAQGCELHRHRLFETNFPIIPPLCSHSGGPVVGVYGGHARKRSAKHGGRGTRDEWAGGHKGAAAEAMGIHWMTLAELSEAIPPAYTQFIGAQLLTHIQRERLPA